jgi:hypothetical protein
MTTPTTADIGHGEQAGADHELHRRAEKAGFRRFKQFSIVTVFVGGAAMGYGGVENDASAAQLALGSDLHDLRRAFRHSTAIYHDTDGLGNGWVRLQDTCFEEDAGTTKLGIVFVNPSRIDGVIDPARPEVLYYEPQSDGALKLMGGEYFCPVEASDAFQPDVPVRGGYEWSRAPRLGLAEQPQWSDPPSKPERRHHVLPVSRLQAELTWSADRTSRARRTPE